MSTSERESASGEEKSKAVLCSKCEHLNAHGANECRRCGSHLYVSCVDCGARNERVRSRCRSCRRRLHRSLQERIAGGFSLKRTGIKPEVIILFIIFMGLAVMLIRYFVNSGGAGFE